MIDCPNKMKVKEQHQYDSTLTGLNDLYIVDYEGNYYIKSSRIIAKDKTIRRNSTYLLFDSSQGKDVQMHTVVLLDCSCKENVILLIVRDLQTQKIFNVHYFIDDGEIKGYWVLIDIQYFNQLLDYKTIKSYCEKCNDTMTTPNTDNKHTQSHDDLLEFEF